MEQTNDEFFITTFDNPFNYFTQFDDWLAFDRNKGYYTLEYLARVARTSEYLSEEANEEEINKAIESIISLTPSLYKKVFKNSIES